MSLFIKKLAVRLATIFIATILSLSAIHPSPKPGDKDSNPTSNPIDNNQQSQNINSTQEDITSASLSQINSTPNLVSSLDSSIIKKNVLLVQNNMSTDFAEIPCLQAPALQYEEQVISCLEQESANLSYLIDNNLQGPIILHNKAINDCNIGNEYLSNVEISNNQFSNIDYPSSSPIDINESNLRCSESELLMPDWSEIKRINLQNNINNKIDTNHSPFSPIQAEFNDIDTSSPGFGTTTIDSLCIPPDQVPIDPSDRNTNAPGFGTATIDSLCVPPDQVPVDHNDSYTRSTGFGTETIDSLCVPPDQIPTDHSDSDTGSPIIGTATIDFIRIMYPS